MDVQTFTATISSIKTATDIVTYLKNTGTKLKEAEIKNKTADLMIALSEIKSEFVDAKELISKQQETIKELNKKLEIQGQLEYEAPYYWVIENGKKDGPFCQCCKDDKDKLIRLQDYKNGHWSCMNCKNGYNDKNWQHPSFTSSDNDFDPIDDW